MNFQEKMFEASAALRAHAANLAASLVEAGRARAQVAAQRLDSSLTVLNGAGRQLNKVARRHASRFVQENSTLASAVRKDFSALARSTFASLAERPAPKKKSRRAISRKRVARTA